MSVNIRLRTFPTEWKSNWNYSIQIQSGHHLLQHSDKKQLKITELTRHGIKPHYVQNIGKGNSYFLHLKTEKQKHFWLCWLNKPLSQVLCVQLWIVTELVLPAKQTRQGHSILFNVTYLVTINTNCLPVFLCSHTPLAALPDHVPTD